MRKVSQCPQYKNNVGKPPMMTEVYILNLKLSQDIEGLVEILNQLMFKTLSLKFGRDFEAQFWSIF